jgi:hypothetical protein
MVDGLHTLIQNKTRKSLAIVLRRPRRRLRGRDSNVQYKPILIKKISENKKRKNSTLALTTKQKKTRKESSQLRTQDFPQSAHIGLVPLFLCPKSSVSLGQHQNHHHPTPLPFVLPS